MIRARDNDSPSLNSIPYADNPSTMVGTLPEMILNILAQSPLVQKDCLKYRLVSNTWNIVITDNYRELTPSTKNIPLCLLALNIKRFINCCLFTNNNIHLTSNTVDELTTICQSYKENKSLSAYLQFEDKFHSCLHSAFDFLQNEGYQNQEAIAASILNYAANTPHEEINFAATNDSHVWVNNIAFPYLEASQCDFHPKKPRGFLEIGLFSVERFPSDGNLACQLFTTFFSRFGTTWPLEGFIYGLHSEERQNLALRGLIQASASREDLKHLPTLAKWIEKMETFISRIQKWQSEPDLTMKFEIATAAVRVILNLWQRTSLGGSEVKSFFSKIFETYQITYNDCLWIFKEIIDDHPRTKRSIRKLLDAFDHELKIELLNYFTSSKEECMDFFGDRWPTHYWYIVSELKKDVDPNGPPNAILTPLISFYLNGDLEKCPAACSSLLVQTIKDDPLFIATIIKDHQMRFFDEGHLLTRPMKDLLYFIANEVGQEIFSKIVNCTFVDPLRTKLLKRKFLK